MVSAEGMYLLSVRVAMRSSMEIGRGQGIECFSLVSTLGIGSLYDRLFATSEIAPYENRRSR